LAPRFVRRLWRRIRHKHRDTLNILLIGTIFVLAGVVAVKKLIP
jgi:hypothetical protein